MDKKESVAQNQTRKALTAKQVKAKFRKNGLTFTAWAKQNNYTRAEVYRVLNGQHKGLYGKSHEIAVKLGMKTAVSNDFVTNSN